MSMNPVTPQQIISQQARMPAGSQATNIEQSRAIAEVQAMFLVAKQAPRDESIAIKRSLNACSEWSVASRAFFSFPRGGETVAGESIVLATELARCWGNVDYGIMELARNDDLGHTEMLAYARDLETNVQSRQTFIVPHTRDTRSGKKQLTDMRDIYENNANNGARRLRECIFRILPAYVKNAAADRCRAVLEKGEGDKPLPLRISEAISAFEGIGVSVDRLVAKHGPTEKWTGIEVANLQIVWQSIKRKEVSVEEAFPRSDDSASVVDDVRRVTAGKKAQGTAKIEPDESEWIAHGMRIRDLIALASSKDELDDAEKAFLEVAALFPEKDRQKLQDDIDNAFLSMPNGKD